MKKENINLENSELNSNDLDQSTPISIVSVNFF